MGNNETGEFELVVGNKQLLNGFFVVVVAVRVGVRHGASHLRLAFAHLWT
jgi:hypothetical protein